MTAAGQEAAAKKKVGIIQIKIKSTSVHQAVLLKSEKWLTFCSFKKNTSLNTDLRLQTIGALSLYIFFIDFSNSRRPKTIHICRVVKQISIQLSLMSTQPGGPAKPLIFYNSEPASERATDLRGSNPCALVISWPHSKSLHPCWARSMWLPWPLRAVCLASTIPYPCHKARGSAQWEPLSRLVLSERGWCQTKEGFRVFAKSLASAGDFLPPLITARLR